MKKLSPMQTAWLKIFHLFFVAAWLGGQMSFLIMQFAKQDLVLPADIYAIISAARIVDYAVIVGGAIGCLITGLIYSAFTGWGFFKFRWLAVKWITTVALVLFGTFFLGPWVDDMHNIASLERAAAFNNPAYLHAEKMNMVWGSLQFALNIFLVIISVLKPRKRKVG